MIRKLPNGSFEVCCHGCGICEDFDTNGFWNALIQEIKDQGWRIFKNRGEWEHFCPECNAAAGAERIAK